MTRSTILTIEHISKAFFGVPAVRDVSIDVKEGEILGLIGQNGAGKSTLMNLVGGVVHPDAGSMTFRGKPYAPRRPADANDAGIGFIHQELNLFTNMTIAENVFISGFPRTGFGPFKFIDRAAMKARTRELLDQVGLDTPPDFQIERMSPGERQLVEIAKALYMDASLIIFDEPTTSLTARETEQLFNIMLRLREQGKSMIYISHILNDVLRLADSIAVMRDGQLVTQEARDAFDTRRMISLMVGRSIEQLYPTRTSAPTTTPLLELKGISAAGIVEKVNLTVHRGELVGLFGLMGSGRTELARMIFGLDRTEQGEIRVAGEALKGSSARDSIRSKIAFVTENRREEGLLMNIAIADNVTLVALPEFARTALQILDAGAMREAAREASQALQLKAADISVQPAKSLSGGNQQKVVIAKWLLSQPEVFIMDEPTRGIDVGAKYEIYAIMDRLAAAGSGVLFISSELEELMGTCDRILVMSQGEIVAQFAREAFSDEAILRAAFREHAPLHPHSGETEQSS
ncbi:MAG: sugar ABC transporter ATP-binding protein [Pleurocapsa minor GSE-CHR-MK-17-07R]|jgi:ABC-type sugar transport system ATPase subunit|nr:sugar ABC transporter ATP-binding protein [Pleurocapsa minor GSE-CHR-MK 17-07R]